MTVDDQTRHSLARDAELIKDPVELAKREALNGLRQFDKAVEMVEYHLDPQRPFRFRPSYLLTLNREALDGISIYAGNYRPGPIEIKGSKHEPPGAHMVPELVEDLCDYVNENWATKTAIHLASYVMWKLNWIHPFADGNGRTSRTASYVVLCLRIGYLLPGKKTIPDQISSNKDPYYRALEAADSVWLHNKIDLAQMEKLLSTLLADQLVSIHEDATGQAATYELHPGDPTTRPPLPS